MNRRVHKLVNTYLSEVLFSGLRKKESKFLTDTIYCLSNGGDVTIMVEGNEIKLSGKIWYELTNHFSLTVSDVHMVMSLWIKENLGIDRKLVMGDCVYTRTSTRKIN